MAEIRLGRWTDPESDTEWQVDSWTQGGTTRHHGENRLTRSGLAGSDKTTFAISRPDGKVIYRTFTGPLPDNIDDLIDYWREGGSL